MDSVQKDLLHGLNWKFPPDNPDYPFREQLERLNQVFPLAGLRVLEPGCGEGYSTVAMASLGAYVFASDARPMVVVKAFARAIFAGVSRRACVSMGRADEIPFPATLDYDLLFHQGLLYHLGDPVAHVRSLRGLFPHIYLNTHVAVARGTNPSLGDLCQFKGYDGRWYREQGWQDELSGIGERSFWLTSESLVRLLSEAGYRIKDVIADLSHAPNGPRVCWLLEASP